MAQSAVIGFGEEELGGALVWRRAHEELVRLAVTRAGHDYEEGRWLLRAERAGAHVRLGFGSFREYAERLFGYSPRLVQEKLRVAEALEELPLLSLELEQGRMSFSAVRELSRVATRATEREWLEAGRGRSIRELEGLVSGHQPGALPDDLPEPGAKRHVLRLEVSGEVLATFREAMAKMRRDAGEPLDDDAAVLLLCRQVLGGPKEEGRSSYQVALTVCEHCKRGMQQGRGELVEVPAEVVEMAECDGQVVGHVGPDAHVGVEPDHVCASREDKRSARAKQSIPPALRRRVARRDGGRCRVPGCRHAVFTDVHHLRLRSEGGENTLENLITLCSAHHRGIHRAELIVEGTPSSGLSFWHADGRSYGASVFPRGGAEVRDARGRIDPKGGSARGKACRVLTELGYRRAEASGALAQVGAQSNESTEELVRLALRKLA